MEVPFYYCCHEIFSFFFSFFLAVIVRFSEGAALWVFGQQTVSCLGDIKVVLMFVEVCMCELVGLAYPSFVWTFYF